MHLRCWMFIPFGSVVILALLMSTAVKHVLLFVMHFDFWEIVVQYLPHVVLVQHEHEAKLRMGRFAVVTDKFKQYIHAHACKWNAICIPTLSCQICVCVRMQ